MENKSSNYWNELLNRKSRVYAGTIGEHLDALAYMQYAIRGEKKQEETFDLEKYRRIVIYIAKKMRKGGLGLNFSDSLAYVEKMQDSRFSRQAYDRVVQSCTQASKGNIQDSQILYRFALCNAEYTTQEDNAIAEDTAREWAQKIGVSISNRSRAYYRALCNKYGVAKLVDMYMSDTKKYNRLRKMISRVHGKNVLNNADAFYNFFKYI